MFRGVRVAVLAAAATTTGSFSAPATPAARVPDRPNIVLIVLDTVRADRVGAQADGATLTPFLDSLAKGAVSFRTALSPADVTPPSHFSILTGLPPDLLSSAADVPEASVVAELNEAGYDTIGLSANPAVDPRALSSFAPFQTFVSSPYLTPTPVSRELYERILRHALQPAPLVDGLDPNLGVLLSSASEMNGRLETLLSGCEPARAGRPVFLFMNFFDAHDPYVPPAPFDASAADLWAAWPVNGDIRHFPIRRGLPPDPHGVSPYMRAANYAPHQLAFLRRLYDGQIRYLDEQLRRTFGTLRAHGILENAIVVVTADHGEALGEDGYLAHGLGGFVRKAYEVPLVIRSFGASVRAGDLPSAIPETIRIADSIREWAGLAGRRPTASVGAFRSLASLREVASASSGGRKRVPAQTEKPVAPSRKAPTPEDEELARRLRSLGYLR